MQGIREFESFADGIQCSGHGACIFDLHVREPEQSARTGQALKLRPLRRNYICNNVSR
jgi:hypothetical protein